MNRKGINTFRERRSNSIAYWELKSWRCQFFSALNTRNICKLVWPYLSSHRRRAEELAIGNMQFSYLLLSWYLAVPRNTPEKKNENKPKTKTKQKKLSPVPTCLNPELHLTPEQEFFEKFFAWRCSFHLQTQSPSNAQTHIWIKKTERRRWAMPTNKNQQKSTQTHLLLPQGHRGVALTRVSLGSGLSSYTLLFSHRRSMCGASSFKNIKYKTLPYSISNHSIYKFIFSKKKKCKRYSNSTQFKFFFSSLNFPKEEFQKQERVWSKAAIPRGSRGAHSPSVWRFSAQSHSGKDIQVWKIRGTLFFGGQVNWNIQAERRQASTRPSPFWQEILFLKRYPSHLPCPSLLVSFWIAMA